MRTRCAATSRSRLLSGLLLLALDGSTRGALLGKQSLLIAYGGLHLKRIESERPSGEYIVDRRGERITVEPRYPLSPQQLPELHPHRIAVALRDAQAVGLSGIQDPATDPEQHAVNDYFHTNLHAGPHGREAPSQIQNIPP